MIAAPLIAGLLAWGVAGAAPVDEPGTIATRRTLTPAPLAGWSVVELRGGVTTHGDAGATLCGEVSPWRYLALESCGSGAGFWDDRRAVTEMVHFRLEGRVPVWSSGGAELSVEPGLGFAEIEQGADAPGFRFGAATTPDQREGAGPEAAVGLKARVWPHPRFFATTELSAGAAWVPSAPTVSGQGSPLVPFLLWTVGGGF